MSDEKKEEVTALVPIRLEPLDLAAIPDAGHAHMALREQHRKAMAVSAVESAGLAVASGSAAFIAWILLGAVGWASYPVYLLVALVFSFAGVGGAMAGTHAIWRVSQLFRDGVSDHFGRSRLARLAKAEGEIRVLARKWNLSRLRLEEAAAEFDAQERALAAYAPKHPLRRGLEKEIARQRMMIERDRRRLEKMREAIEARIEALRGEVEGDE